jgi:hypothetical protein
LAFLGVPSSTHAGTQAGHVYGLDLIPPTRPTYALGLPLASARLLVCYAIAAQLTISPSAQCTSLEQLRVLAGLLVRLFVAKPGYAYVALGTGRSQPRRGRLPRLLPRHGVSHLTRTKLLVVASRSSLQQSTVPATACSIAPHLMWLGFPKALVQRISEKGSSRKLTR